MQAGPQLEPEELQALRRAPHRLDALLAAGKQIVGETDPNSVLRRVVELAVELTGARWLGRARVFLGLW